MTPVSTGSQRVTAGAQWHEAYFRGWPCLHETHEGRWRLLLPWDMEGKQGGQSEVP